MTLENKDALLEYAPSTLGVDSNAALSRVMLNDALTEVTRLWTSTATALQSARGSLYDFLGATYEHADWISRNASAFADLRSNVRRVYRSDRDKKRAEQASADELLLAAALGIEQASLRSKYKRLLAKAREANVAVDRESFKDWLKATGGIVSALRDAIESTPTKRTSSVGSRSFQSCAGDLLRNRDSHPVESRAFGKQPYQGFALALFHIDPRTKQARMMSELTDPELIERAVRLASAEQSPVMDRVAA